MGEAGEAQPNLVNVWPVQPEGGHNGRGKNRVDFLRRSEGKKGGRGAASFGALE